MLWETVKFLVHAGTRMADDSFVAMPAGVREFHVDGPATPKLRGS